MQEMPMFPLGSVLVPGMVLPLHIFEPRYRELVTTCLAADGEFGVALIHRGSEVGGGDERSDVATVARIVEAVPFDDGRWAIGSIGMRRVHIVEWLADDPFPRAVVTDWPDRADGDSNPESDLGDVIGRLRRLLALRAELGQPAAPATSELADDPTLATYQAAVLSGAGPLDLLEVLSCDSRKARLELVSTLVDDQLDVAEGQLRLDATDDDG